MLKTMIPVEAILVENFFLEVYPLAKKVGNT